MNQQTPTIEYAVDLTRDEYVRSQELLSRRGGSFVGSRWLPIAMLVVCVVMSVANFVQYKVLDWSLISLLLLLVISEVWLLVDMPKQLRRRSEAAYDASVYNGYTFAGTITVESDAIRKRTATATAVIPYEQCRLFLESAEMMIFCGPDGKSIVIPSRFLTEETAEQTRRTALAHIPPMRQVLLQPVQPAAQIGTISVAPAKSEEAILTVDVEYTDNEMVGLAAEASMQRFFHTMPGRVLLATMIASVGFFMADIRPLPLFLLVLLAFFLITTITARIKMRRAITRTERNICRIRVELSDFGVRLIGKAERARPMRIPWQHITRAVNCQNTVELYAGTDKQLSIPKRCILNFDEFSAVVDGHMN